MKKYILKVLKNIIIICKKCIKRLVEHKYVKIICKIFKKLYLLLKEKIYNIRKKYFTNSLKWYKVLDETTIKSFRLRLYSILVLVLLFLIVIVLFILF